MSERAAEQRGELLFVLENPPGETWMTVAISRMTVIKMYCFCREAERSVHRCCDPANAWEAFREYYSAGKRSALQELTARLEETVGAGRYAGLGESWCSWFAGWL